VVREEDQVFLAELVCRINRFIIALQMFKIGNELNEIILAFIQSVPEKSVIPNPFLIAPGKSIDESSE
jgi:hypothetical protein